MKPRSGIFSMNYKMRNSYKNINRNLQGRHFSGDLDKDEKMIINCILELGKECEDVAQKSVE
jgi:hypothetical protein